MRLSARAVSVTSATGVRARSAKRRRELGDEHVELAAQRVVARGDLVVAGRRLHHRAEERAVALVEVDAGAQAAADRGGILVRAHLGQPVLDLEQLVDRLAADAPDEVAEVVEVAIEDRAPQAGPAHDLVDGELGVGAGADELGRRGHDPVAALLAGLAGLPHGHRTAEHTDVDTV